MRYRDGGVASTRPYQLPTLAAKHRDRPWASPAEFGQD
jgi:hypothetical protein